MSDLWTPPGADTGRRGIPLLQQAVAENPALADKATAELRRRERDLRRKARKVKRQREREARKKQR